MNIFKNAKRTKGRTVLRIIIAVLMIWILIVLIDIVRFFTSDKPISPLICIESNGCHCFEWREKVGMGYLFEYTYNSEEPFNNGKPDHAVYKFYLIDEEKIQFERK